MRRLPMFAILFAVSSSVLAGNTATPIVFAPGTLSGTGDNGAVAFTPDGATVYVMRSEGDGSALLESHRAGAQWSAPHPAPFSGRWRDLDPAMAPDGSYLVFVSNRPASGEGSPIDAVRGGRRTPGHGMNLWRVAREGNGWGKPVRLPDAVNTCSMTFAPSVAADGSLYYIGCAEDDSLRLKRAAFRNGHYQAPQLVALGDATMQIRDPAIAPDQSFIVVSIKRAMQQSYRLAIAFATPQGWSVPQDLGDDVNGGTHAMGAQLGPDGRTLYFYSDRRAPDADANQHGDRIWQLSLAPWLNAHEQADAVTDGPWNQAEDASPAFTPDGNAVVFSRGSGIARRLYMAERRGANWTSAAPVSFSQTWMDIEPAMAPDGSYLVFISSRPAHAGGPALDGFFTGKSWPGRGGNVWKVARNARGWGIPQRLPDIVNANSSIFAPAMAADSSLYFMRHEATSGKFHLYRSPYQDGHYQSPQALTLSDGVSADFDPAVAPDQSFIVFSSNRPPSTGSDSALFIAFAKDGGWTTPQPLGPAGTESRLSPDLATLYYSGADQRIHSFPLGAWLKQHRTRS
jgi:Tol biopolymer transport system component